MSFTLSLNKHFDIVTASKTEQDFYMNVYRYFDYIFTHPELEQLYEQAGKDYRKKHGAIWAEYDRKTDTNGDILSAQTTRAEIFDMYSNAVGLEVRVYEKIKHYQECEDGDSCGDVCGALLVRGLDFVLRRIKPDYRSVRDKKKEILNTYNGWYKNQRDRYQHELDQFHMMFLVEVEKLDSLEVPKTKELKPFLNINTGDFTYFGKEGNFPTSGQEFKVLKTLLNADDCKTTHDELIQSYLPSVEKATKTQKSQLHTIIRNIKIKLGVLPESNTSKPDPFMSVRGEGYRLVL